MAAMSTELSQPSAVCRQTVSSATARHTARSGLLLRDWAELVASNLLRMKGRVAMTALGVVVGTASLVVLVSLGAGLQQQALESLGAGVTELRVSGGTRIESATLAGVTRRSARASGEPVIVDTEGLARIEALPEVAWAVPFEPVRGALEVQGGQMCQSSINLIGLDPERAASLALEVAWGRLELGAGQVVLGAQAAQGLMKSAGAEAASPAALLNQPLNLYARRFDDAGAVVEKRVRIEVVGILAPRGGSYDFAFFMAEREVVTLNSWLLTQRRDPARQGYTEVVVKVSDVRETAAVERRLTGMGFNVTSTRQQAEMLEAYFGELQALLGGIAAISLLVAAFSIANTMLMAVAERTREIGLMKAIGASHGDVMAVFVGEAGSIGLLGGLGGVGLGLAINALINLQGDDVAFLRQMYGAGTRLQAVTPGWLPFFALSFAMGVGVLAGLVPALRAARLRPLAALKSR